MPKPLRIIVVVISLILVIGFGYLLMGSGRDKPDNTTATTMQSNAPVPTESVQPTQYGKYTDYSAEAVASTKGQRILFFHAPWCPQCRQLDLSIKSGTVPNDVTIFKVDYDSNQKLRQQYGVTIQTTLVLLDDKGNEVKKHVAYDQPNLNTLIEKLL